MKYLLLLFVLFVGCKKAPQTHCYNCFIEYSGDTVNTTATTIKNISFGNPVCGYDYNSIAFFVLHHSGKRQSVKEIDSTLACYEIK